MTPLEEIASPAYRALRAHAMECARCASGTKCVTGNALTATLLAVRLDPKPATETEVLRKLDASRKDDSE